jgi:hypothetical protein
MAGRVQQVRLMGLGEAGAREEHRWLEGYFPGAGEGGVVTFQYCSIPDTLLPRYCR